MQLTIDSAEPLNRVLAVVGALYGVELTTANRSAVKAAPKSRALSDDQAAIGTRPRPQGGRRTRRTAAAPPNPASVRAWAKSNGHAVSDRGRVPAQVIAAYVAAGSPTD